MTDFKGRLEYELSKRYTLWNIPFLPTIRYPLRAARMSVDMQFFGCWWVPRFHQYDITERARCEGETIWSARWLFWQISYSRWL